jgi:hypothetical protein
MTDTNPFPLALLVRCCDNHVECDAAPREAVHRFMDPDLRRKNRDAALAALRQKHAGNPRIC